MTLHSSPTYLKGERSAAGYEVTERLNKLLWQEVSYL